MLARFAASPRMEAEMLQSSEIQKRFSSIQQAIGQASQSLQSETSVPMELKECIQRLDRETNAAQQVMQSQDESRIRQCVDDLESIGDEAKRVCRSQGAVNPQVAAVVTRVHDELSDLKHQLH